MFEDVQVITENEQAKFVVIPYAKFVRVRDLLANEDELADYLDYLHMQAIKKQNGPRHSMADIKRALAIE